jgi:hypothetical protein
VVGDHYRLIGWRSAYRGLASDIVDDTILNQLLTRLTGWLAGSVVHMTLPGPHLVGSTGWITN